MFFLLKLVYKLTKMVVKLGAYGLLGYLVYEVVLGVTDAKAHGEDPEKAILPAAKKAVGAVSSAASTLTGAAKQGVAVAVRDSGGVEHQTRVGRGVVSR